MKLFRYLFFSVAGLSIVVLAGIQYVRASQTTFSSAFELSMMNSRIQTLDNRHSQNDWLHTLMGQSPESNSGYIPKILEAFLISTMINNASFYATDALSR